MKDHNFQVSIGGEGILEGGPLAAKYHFAQFHFHWGGGNTWGSEHMVNGVSSPAELHCVFVNSNYGSVEEALEHADGLAVIGVFLQIGNHNNQVIDKICTQTQPMKSGEEKIISPGISLNNLIPRNLSKYYTYPGSLTTPPCSECVTWIVLDEAIVVTETQTCFIESLNKVLNVIKQSTRVYELDQFQTVALKLNQSRLELSGLRNKHYSFD